MDLRGEEGREKRRINHYVIVLTGVLLLQLAVDLVMLDNLREKLGFLFRDIVEKVYR